MDDTIRLEFTFFNLSLLIEAVASAKDSLWKLVNLLLWLALRSPRSNKLNVYSIIKSFSETNRYLKLYALHNSTMQM